MSTYKDDSIKVCCTSGSPQPSGGDSSPYQCRGSLVTLDNTTGLRGYLVGTGSRGVVVAYDIFGFDIGNTRRFVDMIADAVEGLTLIMPDFYRGRAWPVEDFPPREGFEAIAAWVGRVGTWEIVEKDLSTTETFLRSRGVSGKLGIVGFCWGGKQAVRACATPAYGAGVSLHGAWLGPEDAEKVQSPMMFLPAGDDPDITPVEKVLRTKSFGAECRFHTFTDMAHGFASTRGKWEDPATRQRIEEANRMTRDFLVKHLIG